MANTIIIKSKDDGAGVPQKITGGDASGMYIGELAVNTSTGTSGAGENRGHIFMGVSHTYGSSESDIDAGGPTTDEYRADQSGGVVWVGAPILVHGQGMAGDSDYMLATVKNIKAYVDAGDAAGDTTLANTKIWIGDSNGAKQEFALSGDVTMTAGGSVSLAANTVDSSELVNGGVDLSHMSSESVDEDNLYISNSGSNGEFLSKQSGNNGGLTWATPAGTANQTLTTGAGIDGADSGSSGNFTMSLGIQEYSDVAIASGDKFLVLDSDGSTHQLESMADISTFQAGAGMTASSGVLNVIGGTAITANANDIAVTADSIGDTQLAYNTGQHLTTGSTVEFAGLTADATTFVGDMSVTADTATFTSTNSADPLVVIKNTTNDATGARLRFVKDKGAAGADGDDIGIIEFVGDDAGQTQMDFAKIIAEIGEADNTDEAGKLTLQVASSDGTTTGLENGIVLTGHKTSDYVDVTIGTGAASTTTIAGHLTVTGTTTTINSTTLTVADDLITVSKGNDTVANANGSGLEIDATGATNLYWKYVHANTAWSSNVDIDAASGKVYKIAGNSVLAAATLGSGVLASSLTSVGTLASGAISSGFGNIDNGTSTLDTGVATVASLVSGGGYGSSGTSISATGVIQTDGAITSGGAITAGGNVTAVGSFIIGSANVNETELEIIDGATVTTAELNIMDGSATTQATVTLVAGDGVVISDADVMKQCLMSDFEVYMEANLDTMGSQFTSASALATVGTLASGAISSGFGNIDNGSSTLDTGAATVASLVCTAAGTFGGGYGSTGTTLATNGNISYNGILTDGTFTMSAGALVGSTIDCGSYDAA